MGMFPLEKIVIMKMPFWQTNVQDIKDSPILYVGKYFFHVINQCLCHISRGKKQHFNFSHYDKQTAKSEISVINYKK